jgi:hypothetical protein
MQLGNLESCKMIARRLFHPVSVFLLFVAVSVLIGASIPQFYDWTGSDQSRPSPWVPITAVAILIVGLSVCATLPWLPFPIDANSESQPFHVGMRAIVLLTTVVALQIALIRSRPMLVPAVGSLLLAIGCTIYFWITYPCLRWRLLSLMACMYLPFVWILLPRALTQLRSERLWLIVGLPGWMPTLLIGSMFRQNPQQLGGADMLFVAWELFIGLWIVSQGPRRAVAFTIFVLILSVFSSFILNAAMRA